MFAARVSIRTSELPFQSTVKSTLKSLPTVIETLAYCEHSSSFSFCISNIFDKLFTYSVYRIEISEVLTSDMVNYELVDVL